VTRMVAAVLLLASVAVVVAEVSISTSPNDLNISPVGSTLQAPSILPQTTPIPALDRQPASHKLIIGNWIAQWDTQYRAWFYYNIKTATSTWTKPAELSHVAFKSSGPTDKKATGVAGGPRQPQKAALRGYRVQAGDLARVKTSHYRQPYSDNLGAGSRLQPAQEKILVSDLETYDFFGYNTTLLSSDRGLLGGLLDSFTGIYDNIVKDYVTDVYTDVIEGYSIATIKLFGWFFFGSMMMFKGLMLDYLVDSGRSFEGRSLGPGAGASR